jgi:hypothetical protein
MELASATLAAAAATACASKITCFMLLKGFLEPRTNGFIDGNFAKELLSTPKSSALTFFC